MHAVQNPVGCVAVQLIKAWGGHVTATVTCRALAAAQHLGVDDIIVYDASSKMDGAGFEALLKSRDKFDLVLNTVGSFLHEASKSVCRQGGVVVTTVASPPASDRYGILLGSLYSCWLRIKLLFTKVLTHLH